MARIRLSSLVLIRQRTGTIRNLKTLRIGFSRLISGVLRLVAVAWAISVTASAQARAEGERDLSMWRLDCGSVTIPDADFLNDAYAFAGMSKTVSVSCYLIQDRGRYMLWDSGLPISRLGKGGRSVGGGPAVLERTVLDQIKQLGVDPRLVTIVALSHYHSDHSGQASNFPWATLMIGAEDFAVVRGSSKAFNLDRSEFAPWLSRNGRVDAVAGDRDVFGDKRVVMLTTPGHTPGHHSLLVRLQSGPVILTGDLWHLREQIDLKGVPTVNTSRADTLASMDRIERIARNLGAQIIIGHEPGDVARLPPFPRAAH